MNNVDYPESICSVGFARTWKIQPLGVELSVKVFLCTGATQHVRLVELISYESVIAGKVRCAILTLFFLPGHLIAPRQTFFQSYFRLVEPSAFYKKKGEKSGKLGESRKRSRDPFYARISFLLDSIWGGGKAICAFFGFWLVCKCRDGKVHIIKVRIIIFERNCWEKKLSLTVVQNTVSQEI